MYGGGLYGGGGGYGGMHGGRLISNPRGVLSELLGGDVPLSPRNLETEIDTCMLSYVSIPTYR